MKKISLDLAPGETLALLGKSGSGKTTLLKCIYGLEDLAVGQVLMQNKKVPGPSFQLIPGHEDMSLVSQDYYVLENHTVAENIFDKLIGYTNEAKEKRANRLLNLLELKFIRNIRAKNLSSGQKQRVAIARALAVFPKLLLLDEPFSNLDQVLSQKLFSFIATEAKKNDTAVILITHIPEEALKFSQRLAIMDNGSIVQIGDTWDVYYRPKNSKLAGLLGYYNVVRPEDLTGKPKRKYILRPDRLVISSRERSQLQLTVMSCAYNGKCFELLCETRSGNSLLIYSPRPFDPETTVYSRILTG